MRTLKDVARKLRSHADFVGSLGGSGELMDSVELGELADTIDSQLLAATPRDFNVQVTAERMEEVINSMQGPDGEACAGTLWVGRLDDCGTDGSSRYGIHISCNECPEEGSVTLAEFDAPKVVTPEKAVAWMIRGSDGSVRWGEEACVFAKQETAQYEADGLYDGDGITWSAFPLYVTPTIPTGYRLVPVESKLIGWRMADYTAETADPDQAKNWSAHVAVLPIFEGDQNTKLTAAPDAGGV